MAEGQEGEMEDMDTSFPDLSPRTLQKLFEDVDAKSNVTRNLEPTVEDEAEEPLSPIVGYDNVDSDVSLSESSETDEEQKAILAKMNERVAQLTGKPFLPDQDSPKSRKRKRLMKIRHKMFNRRLQAAVQPKRLKVSCEDDNENHSGSSESMFIESSPVTTAASHVPSTSSCGVDSIGFKTASGKDIVVSDKAKQKARSLWLEIANDEPSNSAGTSNSILPQTMPLAFAVASTSSMLGNEPQSKMELEAGSVDNICGFKTASGKEIIISEKAKQRAKSLCLEGYSGASIQSSTIPTNLTFKSTMLVQDGGNISHVLAGSVQIDTASSSKDNMQPHGSVETFGKDGGFKTASGRDIHISEGAKNKVKGLFLEGCGADFFAGTKPINTPFKPPTMRRPIRKEPTSTSTEVSVKSDAAPGMTQEVLDCIQACLADGDDFTM